MMDLVNFIAIVLTFGRLVLASSFPDFYPEYLKLDSDRNGIDGRSFLYEFVSPQKIITGCVGTRFSTGETKTQYFFIDASGKKKFMQPDFPSEVIFPSPTGIPGLVKTQKLYMFEMCFPEPCNAGTCEISPVVASGGWGLPKFPWFSSWGGKDNTGSQDDGISFNSQLGGKVNADMSNNGASIGTSLGGKLSIEKGKATNNSQGSNNSSTASNDGFKSEASSFGNGGGTSLSSSSSNSSSSSSASSETPKPTTSTTPHPTSTTPDPTKTPPSLTFPTRPTTKSTTKPTTKSTTKPTTTSTAQPTTTSTTKPTTTSTAQPTTTSTAQPTTTSTAQPTTTSTAQPTTTSTTIPATSTPPTSVCNCPSSNSSSSSNSNSACNCNTTCGCCDSSLGDKLLEKLILSKLESLNNPWPAPSYWPGGSWNVPIAPSQLHNQPYWPFLKSDSQQKQPTKTGTNHHTDPSYYARLPGAIRGQAPVIYYPSCDPDAYYQPAIINYCTEYNEKPLGDWDFKRPDFSESELPVENIEDGGIHSDKIKTV